MKLDTPICISTTDTFSKAIVYSSVTMREVGTASIERKDNSIILHLQVEPGRLEWTLDIEEQTEVTNLGNIVSANLKSNYTGELNVVEVTVDTPLTEPLNLGSKVKKYKSSEFNNIDVDALTKLSSIDLLSIRSMCNTKPLTTRIKRLEVWSHNLVQALNTLELSSLVELEVKGDCRVTNLHTWKPLEQLSARVKVEMEINMYSELLQKGIVVQLEKLRVATVSESDERLVREHIHTISVVEGTATQWTDYINTVEKYSSSRELWLPKLPLLELLIIRVMVSKGSLSSNLEMYLTKAKRKKNARRTA